jgi:hypothetical protein
LRTDTDYTRPDHIKDEEIGKSWKHEKCKLYRNSNKPGETMRTERLIKRVPKRILVDNKSGGEHVDIVLCQKKENH